MHLGEGEVFVDEFLGHAVMPFGGALFSEDEVVGAITAAGLEVVGVRHRDALPHEYPSRRLYLSATRAR